MKKLLNHLGRVLLGTASLFVLWMASLIIAEQFIPSELDTSQVPEVLFFYKFFLVCLTHVILLYMVIRHSRWAGIRLVLTIFLLIFVIQYFLSMIEALWFNNSLNMPVSGIQSILLSGFLLAILFSPLMVWIGGGFNTGKRPAGFSHRNLLTKEMIVKTAALVIFIYPLLYFLAGYYIAWQFESVRLFYTGSPEMQSFMKMMAENFRSGLYGFQILRGIIWVGIAIQVYRMIRCNYWQKGIMIGSLFALLMNAQHLLPNPYFPSEVSMVHFIETASSNFIWGFIIVLVVHGADLNKRKSNWENNPVLQG